MDGIHDLGGLSGFGRVEREANEPVFHEVWEGRTCALVNLRPAELGIDEFRHAIERMPARRYLASSYYERWLTALETLLVEHGLVTEETLREARSRVRGDFTTSCDGREPRERGPRRGAKRPTSREPRYRAGDAVRADDRPRRGHTRLPRYARGKRGRIGEVYPTFVLPDTAAHGAGEHPEPVYAVLFDGRELWGDAGEERTVVSLDLFESYLEPVDG